MVAVLYTSLFILMSIPRVQNAIKTEGEKQLSQLLNSKITIERFTFHPFNEAILNNITLYTPDGEECAKIEKLGAGISIGKLIFSRKIEISFAEIIGLEASLWQKAENEPLNIQFLIDAFASKDKKTPPPALDLKLRNVVMRQSKISFDKRWKAYLADEQRFDANHIAIESLNADISFPKITNDSVVIDLRRLSFAEQHGFDVKKLSTLVTVATNSLSVNKLNLDLANSEFRVSDIKIGFDKIGNIYDALNKGNYSVTIEGDNICPADFKCFVPQLSRFDETYEMRIAVSGNISDIELNDFTFESYNDGMALSLTGKAQDLPDKENGRFEIDNLDLFASHNFIIQNLDLIPGISPSVTKIISNVGNLNLELEGEMSIADKAVDMEASLSTAMGDISLSAMGKAMPNDDIHTRISLSTDELNLSNLLNNKTARIAINAESDIKINKAHKLQDIELSANIPHIVYNEANIKDIDINFVKTGSDLKAYLNTNSDEMTMWVVGEVTGIGDQPRLTVNANISNLMPSQFGLLEKYPGYGISATIDVNAGGSSLDDVIGNANISNFSFANEQGDGVYLKHTDLKISGEEEYRNITLTGDFLNADVTGLLHTKDFLPAVKTIAHSVLPSLVEAPENYSPGDIDIKFNANIMPFDDLADFLNLPVRPLEAIRLNGTFDTNSVDNIVSVNMNAPYILQGKNKLIKDVSLQTSYNYNEGANVSASLNFPAKHDRLLLNLSLKADDDKVYTDIGWQGDEQKTNIGKISTYALLSRDVFDKQLKATLKINRSQFTLGNATWNIEPGYILYADRKVSVRGLKVMHDMQYVNIEGTASADPIDGLKVSLAGIDLNYIFDTLNINYVNFGGLATGDFYASNLFGSEPIAYTPRLAVKDFSYNNAVLGDALLRANWDNKEKGIMIYADALDDFDGHLDARGGVYLGRDSIGFSFDAQKINLSLLKPFVSGFTSDVGGRATAKLNLYGTFKDINLTGWAYADSISIKVDQSNVYYHGSDSVFLYTDKLDIPHFTVYDKYGNKGLLSGYMTHENFRNPKFEFKLTDTQNLLCFDTDASINPVWYGRIFGTGNASLRGMNELVSLQVNMLVEANSNFTFALNQSLTAEQYSFLTFSDKSKPAETEVHIAKTFEEIYSPQNIEETSIPTTFILDLRADVYQDSRLTLIMDPRSGDKITATGNGSVSLAYNTRSDEMKMYGSYTVQNGNYNFRLQDLIIKDFSIRPGSEIKFDGDPMQAKLDIIAAYRVNTNLSDLDKSFSTDRDLNRTNVPVDALLLIKGDLQKTEIDFDIALPTLTSDVERKVKSIISTEDMMKRQIIYLLALSRFYTPEYMGMQSNGGELASVASTTISSQLQNAMGQLTDKVSFAPSIRSDKGDFSDMEVDLNLSSRLLNNRLLINGNFGYRDRSTSQTTFVGDFDLEYVLSNNGNLRLKAYNHFNDQYYYLKSALTTQGIGIIFRKEFDNLFKRQSKDKDK